MNSKAAKRGLIFLEIKYYTNQSTLNLKIGQRPLLCFNVLSESDPICSTNATSIGFIGTNKCNIKPDMMNISCSVRYIGNIAPDLRWFKRDSQNSHVENVINLPVSHFRDAHVITVSLLMAADEEVYPAEQHPLYFCRIVSSLGGLQQTETGQQLLPYSYHCQIVDLKIIGKRFHICFHRNILFVSIRYFIN